MSLPCRYLYKSTSPGVQDYLCNRLYSLPEAGIERYLSQLCQLVIHKPHSPLEKVLADLCARSLRIAVKVSCHSSGGCSKAAQAGVLPYLSCHGHVMLRAQTDWHRRLARMLADLFRSLCVAVEGSEWLADCLCIVRGWCAPGPT